MLQVVRILKTLFLVLYLEFKTSLSLVTQVLFQQGCLTYRQEDGLLHHMLLNELEFNVKKGGGGANKKNSLRDTISNSGKMFLSFCPC